MRTTELPDTFSRKTKPNYGYYYLKPYMVMLGCFLAFGSGIMIAGWKLENPWVLFIGAGVIFYGIATIIGWALARYVIPGSRISVAQNAIALLELKGHEKVLDVGSGRGIFAIETAKQLGSGEVSAIDLWEPEKVRHIKHRHTLSQPSENTIANAAKNAAIEGVDRKINFINMDANHLDFAPDTFDAVICGFIVGHQGPYSLNTLKQVRKVLKPGGQLLIIDSVRDFTYFLLSTPHLFLLSYIRGTKARRLTAANWKAQVETAGFRIVHFLPRRGIITIQATNHDN